MSFPRRIIDFIVRVLSRRLRFSDGILLGRWKIFDRSCAAVRVFVAAPEVESAPDSRLPEPLRSAIKEMAEQVPRESALAPLIQLGSKGVYIEAVLNGGRSGERPVFVVIDENPG